jgi:hypothetical protein
MNFFKSTFAVVAVSLSFMAAVHADDGGNFGSEAATVVAAGQADCDDCTNRPTPGKRSSPRVGFNSPISGALTGTGEGSTLTDGQKPAVN